MALSGVAIAGTGVVTEDGEVVVAWPGVPRNRTLEGQQRTDGVAVFGIRLCEKTLGVDNPFSAGVSFDRAGYGLEGWLEVLDSADSAVVTDCVREQGSRFADLDHPGVPSERTSLPLGDGVVLVFGMTERQRVAKRAFDVVFSLVAVILLFPFLFAIGLGVLISSRGPVLYRGIRVGEGGRPFDVLKFRTMTRDADERLTNDPDLFVLYRANGFKLPQESDPRITSIGRFLRRTSLDELPQLWNILVGDMSVVGARPVVPDELEDYGPLAPVYLGARPGLTGHWQVYGRGRVGFPERAYLDLQNLLNWKLRSDIGLILRTLPAVLSSRGAY